MKISSNMGIWIVLLIVTVLMIALFGVIGLIVGALLIIAGLFFVFGGKRAGAGTLTALAGSPKWFAIIMIFIITMIVAGIISLTWGILGLLGLFLMFASFYVLFLQRGNVAMTFRNPFVILFATSLFFIFMSFSGLDSAWIVDLSIIPGFTELNMMMG